MSITLNWNNVADCSADQVLQMLRDVSRTYEETTILDYTFMPGEDCCGLYFFFDTDALAYVGKCSSRAFIERVPSHLDYREDSYFGTLLQKMAGTRDVQIEGRKKKTRKKKNVPNEAHVRKALGFKVALLAINRNEKFKFRDLETELRRLWQPYLNKDKLRNTTGSMTLRELAFRQ